MWFWPENMLVSYADDATLLVRISSSNMTSDVTESLSRNVVHDVICGACG